MIKVKDFLDNIVNEKDLNETPVMIAVVESLKRKVNTVIDSTKSLPQMKSYIDANAMTLLDEVIRDSHQNLVLDEVEKELIIDRLRMNLFGYGVIEPLLRDESINEIMVNSYNRIYVEKDGMVIRAMDKANRPLSFKDDIELRNIIERIITPLNRTVNESNPVVDGRLPNGHRVNAILYPVSLQGTSLTIRKFPDIPFSLQDLVEKESLTVEIAKVLEDHVTRRKNIIVSGSTSSGKTTFLNVLSSMIPANERIITIEDSAELRFSQVENIVRLEARPNNIEGEGEITIRDLVRNSLRMRPDRIVVGEVRGVEAIDMLQAMNTGHDGSLTTIHSNSALDTISRLETMVLMASGNLPLRAIRQQISSAVNYIVHLKRYSDGVRRVSEIIEVNDLKGEDITVSKCYEYVPKR